MVENRPKLLRNAIDVLLETVRTEQGAVQFTIQGFVETPLGWIAVGGGALAMLGSGDMVIQCLEGELN